MPRTMWSEGRMVDEMEQESCSEEKINLSKVDAAEVNFQDRSHCEYS